MRERVKNQTNPDNTNGGAQKKGHNLNSPTRTAAAALRGKSSNNGQTRGKKRDGESLSWNNEEATDYACFNRLWKMDSYKKL